MRNNLWIVLLFPLFLFSEEYLLDLGHYGSVRYIYEGEKLLSVERLTVLGEVAYTHSYRYNPEGRLISEKLIGNLGEIVYGEGKITSPYSSEEIAYLPEEGVIRHTVDGIVHSYPFHKVGELVTSTPNICRDEPGQSH